VELLAGVACLDGAEISPVCLEIAQLCGRLPLCLSIVGNLIRTCGDGWQEEVPMLLKTVLYFHVQYQVRACLFFMSFDKDMKALTQDKTESSGRLSGLNLQQRVIQSGKCVCVLCDTEW
jgi:hypothetical protein